ncbi:MAG: MBL fold metallo-hydrolase [Gammaproteobacteria bacterium]|nr:MBL fold metallo-hydrolase [Gammaproteobacteria bacterium]
MSRIVIWVLLIFAGVMVGVVIGLGLGRTDAGRLIDERRAEVVGTFASAYVASQTEVDEREQVKTVASLQHIDVEVDQPAPGVFRAWGVGNTFLIPTEAGHVLFDAGLGTQSARQKRLLQEAAPGEVTHIILSHSHADHIGGTKFWLAEFPDARVITHAKFLDGQTYLKALEQYFWSRNRLLYPFMPESPPEEGFVVYGGVAPDIQVREGEVLRLDIGGVTFEIIGTAGAEGEDNIVLWLPESKVLFSGDFFGPLFPMVPNLFTLRGEKFRDPLAYVRSLDQLIALEPEMVLPSHFGEVVGRDAILRDMRKMRDATQYIHDATIAGMNRGESIWDLMRTVKLPPELALSQGHGKVSWNVRSIWEHYSTWFHFESTTELYPLQVRELYAEIAALGGGAAAFESAARRHLDDGSPEAALHMVEIGLAASEGHAGLLDVRLDALNQLLTRAFRDGSNYSETGWLKSRIAATEARLSESRSD